MMIRWIVRISVSLNDSVPECILDPDERHHGTADMVTSHLHSTSRLMCNHCGMTLIRVRQCVTRN